MKINKTFCSFLSITLTTLFFLFYWNLSFNVKQGHLKLIPSIPYDNLIQNTLITPNISKCTESQHYPLELLIMVTSYVGHIELRSAHRRAMPTRYLNTYNATRVFLLAQIPNNERYITQAAVKDESSIFGDILQGSFLENYRNLTYKHMMGLHWVATQCNRTKYILKVDDDIVFNLEQTIIFLKTLKNIDRTKFLMGYVFNDSVPKRITHNKWYVSYEEYPLDVYPKYVSGWYYITTPEVAAGLCIAASYHNYFWIDDIFVTGILTRNLNIEVQPLPKNYWLEYYELLECCLKDMIMKYIKCSYVVGPNGNRNNLIYEFNNAVKLCQSWNNCTDRPEDRPLKKNCVTFRERPIFGNGEPEVHHIKIL